MRKIPLIFLTLAGVIGSTFASPRTHTYTGRIGGFKHKSGEGPRECARRVRQIASGMLRAG